MFPWQRVGIAYALGLALMFVAATVADLDIEALRSLVVTYGAFFVGLLPLIWFLWGLHMVFTCAAVHRDNILRRQR